MAAPLPPSLQSARHCRFIWRSRARLHAVATCSVWRRSNRVVGLRNICFISPVNPDSWAYSCRFLAERAVPSSRASARGGRNSAPIPRCVPANGTSLGPKLRLTATLDHNGLGQRREQFRTGPSDCGRWSRRGRPADRRDGSRRRRPGEARGPPAPSGHVRSAKTASTRNCGRDTPSSSTSRLRGATPG
jgi:hypothetical protein